MIRVLIADDHQLFADSLALGIDAVPDIVVVATASNGQETLDRLTEAPVDVLVMDLEMPIIDGLGVLGQATDLPPTIIVTMHASPEQERIALEAGARAFLAKSTALSDLAATIRALYAGEDLLDSTTHSEIWDRHRQAQLDEGAAALTTRERELLGKMTEGLTSTPELADALFISEKTVKNHLASIYDKLGVNDRAQAIVEAINRGVASTATPINGSGDL